MSFIIETVPRDMFWRYFHLDWRSYLVPYLPILLSDKSMVLSCHEGLTRCLTPCAVSLLFPESNIDYVYSKFKAIAIKLGLNKPNPHFLRDLKICLGLSYLINRLWQVSEGLLCQDCFQLCKKITTYIELNDCFPIHFHQYLQRRRI